MDNPALRNRLALELIYTKLGLKEYENKEIDLTMTFSTRYYAYGLTPHNEIEFLHTFLSSEEAVSYIKKHSQLFGKTRYVSYWWSIASDPTQHFVEI